MLCGPPATIRGNLLVDGYSVLHELYSKYKIEWATGGCYVDQVRATQEYYGALVRSGVKPIVVLDGGGTQTSIDDAVHSRNREINGLCGYLRKQHENTDKECKEYSSHLLPILSRHVYLSSLKKMKGVQVLVADGKAFEMVVQLANSYKCPVLTNNSNFCVSGVKAGVIFTFNLCLSDVTAPIFEQSKLVSLLDLPNPDLLFAIVAIMGDGNDTTVPYLYHGGIKVDIEKVCKRQGINIKDRHRYFNIVDYMRVHKCKSFGDFEKNIDTFNFGYNQKEELAKNCRNAFETYNILGMERTEDIIAHTTLQCHASHGDFHSVVQLHRYGNYPITVLDAICVGKCLLDSDVGDAEQLPVPFLGQQVRQIIYGLATPFMNRSFRTSISEYCRSEKPRDAAKPWEYEPFIVKPLWRYKELAADLISEMKPEEREKAARKAILDVLKSPRDILQILNKPTDKMYLLGIITTHYWGQHINKSCTLEDPLQLIRALILNFLMCPLEEEIYSDQNYFNPMWIKVYHALLEWQCLYKDVCGLNQMLLSPFKELPLTNILNGSFVIELALSRPECITDHRRRLGPQEQDLFDRIVYILTR